MPPIEANQQDYRVIEKSELSLTCRQNCLLSAASFSFTNSTMNLQPRPIEPLPPPPRPGLHISPREEELGRKLKEMLDTLDTEREGTRQWKNSSKLQNRTDAGRGIPVRDYLSCDALVHRIIPPCAMNSQVRTTNHVLSEYRVA